MILSLYDKSKIMVRPWQEVGYDTCVVDIQHPPGVGKSLLESGSLAYTIGADILTWVPPKEIVDKVEFVAAFPPCTALSVSGARWMKDKGLGELSHAIDLFARAIFWGEWFGVPYFVENPVSTISTYFRKPDCSFHPWQYSGYCADDNYTKKTCLWTGGGFELPPFNHPEDIEPDDRIHKAGPSPTRGDFRAATPKGFAWAVARQYCHRAKGPFGTYRFQQ